MSGRKPFTEEQFRKNFEDKYIPEPMSGCWLWTASTFPFGYGKLKHKRKDVSAHRTSWLLYKGDIPEGMFVCHKCDIPACVNPDHLFLGTSLDNMRDCAAKGRKFNQRKTHCKHGHSLSGDNLKIVNGGRRCVACAYAVNAKWRYSKKGRDYMIARRK